ncbi:MAG: type I-E CRISPR-associated protein Cas6/Cse3/CasE [Polyangiaceae bacterium]|nr:type I-E CRISPR-associated protein Cas6/Cse3/CasE [Polyangiaceae bacterium]
MYLARAFLNPVSTDVRRTISSPELLHKRVMLAFPNNTNGPARETHGVLHRLDEDSRRGRIALHIQSRTEPNFSRFRDGFLLDLNGDLGLDASFDVSNPAVVKVSDDWDTIKVGDAFAFRLVANTTKRIAKVDQDSGSKTKNGMRVGLRGDEERLQWLTRHALAGGFEIDQKQVQVAEIKPNARSLDQHQPQVKTFAGARFDGFLRVTDTDLFRKTLEKGVGPAKAYGFGLLSIRRQGVNLE